MFKSTSQNLQHSARNSIANDRKNSFGIDASAFKDEEEYRNALRVKKKELESKAAKLKAQIKLARRRYTYKEHGQVSLATVERWEAERGNVASLVTDIDARLTEIKLDRHVARKVAEASFEAAFLKCAKEILAGPVFDRILMAAIHRSSESAE